MRAFVLALFLAIASFVGVAFAADPVSETNPSFIRYKFAEAELSLASKEKFYVVFDFEKKAVLLKARGSVFKNWPMESVQQFGEDIPLEVLPLQKRSHNSDMLRVRIQPPDPDEVQDGEDDSGKPKKQPKIAELAKDPNNPKAPQNVTAPAFDALEIGDMPFNYALSFPKNLTVNVSADDPAVKVGYFERLKKDAAETYRMYKLKKGGDQSIVLNLKMSQADARALYWALGDSMNVLFWIPPR